MPPTKPLYVWQQPSWPKMHFDHQRVGVAVGAARRLQGRVEGAARALGIEPDGRLVQAAFEAEALATAAIEGEKLDRSAVRSSVLRRLGLRPTGSRDRTVEGLVDVIDDATTAFEDPLDSDRLCRWHAALFPGGTSGIRRIAFGRYRQHDDPMQIFSGRPGREVVHYEAPPSKRVPAEMDRFLDWFAATAPEPGQAAQLDGLARAAVAHVWFESIHPFEDGNGRIGRAIMDLALAQDLRSPVRLISLSRQLLESRSAYYDELNAAQRGGGDVTAWIEWFAAQYSKACEWSISMMDQALAKARFWSAHAGTELNERQRKVVQRLLDAGDGGFLGGLNAEKYMKLTSISKPSATRDLSELVKAGLLRPSGQGRARRYQVNVPGWTHGLDEESAPADGEREPDRPRPRG